MSSTNLVDLLRLPARAAGLPALNEMLNVEAEHRRDPAKNDDGWVALPTLDPAQVGLMHGCQMGKLLLRQAFLPSGILQIQADADPHIHEAMDGTPTLAPIDYQS